MPSKTELSAEDIAFYKPLVASYLKHGSVDKVFSQFSQDTGVSYPHFHRILKQWGIIKSAGPQSHLTEAIFFLTALAKKQLPLESIYKTMPPSLRISAVTLHRILSYVKKGLTRRVGTALLVRQDNDLSSVLVGRDISTPRPELGKPYASLSLPMTYARKHESYHDSILRTIQQEVASNLTVNRLLPTNLVPNNPQAIMTIDIADVRVRVFEITVPESLTKQLDSQKLTNLSFMSLDEIARASQLDSYFRAGVPEIARAYLDIQNEAENSDLIHLNSYLNQRLALLPV